MSRSNKDPPKKPDSEQGTTDENPDSEEEDETLIDEERKKDKAGGKSSSKTRSKKPVYTTSVKCKSTKKGSGVKAKSKKSAENELLKAVKQVCEQNSTKVRSGEKRQRGSRLPKLLIKRKIKAIKAPQLGIPSPKKCLENPAWNEPIVANRRRVEEAESDTDNDADDAYEYDTRLSPSLRALQMQIMDLTLPLSPSTRLRIRRLVGYLDRRNLEKVIRLTQGQAALSASQCKQLLKTYKDKRMHVLLRCRMRRAMRQYWERRRRREQAEQETDNEDEEAACSSDSKSPGRGRKRRSPPDDDDEPRGKIARRRLF